MFHRCMANIEHIPTCWLNALNPRPDPLTTGMWLMLRGGSTQLFLAEATSVCWSQHWTAISIQLECAIYIYRFVVSMIVNQLPSTLPWQLKDPLIISIELGDFANTNLGFRASHLNYRALNGMNVANSNYIPATRFAPKHVYKLSPRDVQNINIESTGTMGIGQTDWTPMDCF